MKKLPEVMGSENIPRNGPVALTANHYQRRGLWIAWSAAAVNSAFVAKRDDGRPPHWLVTGGLRWLQFANRGAEIPLTRQLLRRVAGAYEMTALPLSGKASRAGAIRDWLAYAERGEGLATFPEGLAGDSRRLRPPEQGFDSLCRVLRRNRIPLVPVAIWEESGHLHVRFGQELELEAVPGHGADSVVMGRIASMLPVTMRGPYGEMA